MQIGDQIAWDGTPISVAQVAGLLENPQWREYSPGRWVLNGARRHPAWAEPMPVMVRFSFGQNTATIDAIRSNNLDPTQCFPSDVPTSITRTHPDFARIERAILDAIRARVYAKYLAELPHQ
jgi:hypothetical protein